ncbi:MAG: class I SAM-dependent methyltransferase [Candidatus Peribacteraceae bacterium]|jgi:SAM-dependent methyltransferase|nr:class I SAM-dependent methyltransferase [Candidatus Peribacteraceae bacterium]|tara:strand:+ start:1573 stop:2256 length:684 start_codon:yes stop_codon:yes gene_type:complete
MTSPNTYEDTKVAWDRKHNEGWGDTDPMQPWIFSYMSGHRTEIGEDILDLGCGKGRYLLPLAKMDFSMTGLDISPDGLEELKRIMEEQRISARLICGSVHDTEFEDSEFDSALSVQVLSHLTWPDIGQTVKNVRRAIKDNGSFILRVRSVSHNNLQSREPIADYGCTYRETSGSKTGIIQHSFTAEEVCLLARQNDFEVVFGPFETKNKKSDGERIRAHWNAVYKAV